MANVERIRQEVPASHGLNDIARRLEEGWKPVAVEWEREVPAEKQNLQNLPGEAHDRQPSATSNQVPFGLHLAPNPPRLEPDPIEQEALFLMMELTIEDGPYSAIAEELNQRGFRTRTGTKWTPVSVFQMLPRLIEVGPKIFATKEWQERRARLAKPGAR